MLAHRASRWLLATVISSCVLGLLAYQAVDTARSSTRRVGVGIDQGSGAIVLTGVGEETPAERAGLRAGDQVLRIGTLRTAKVSDWDRAAASFEAGRPVAVEIERAGRRQVRSLVPGSPFPWGRYGLNALVALSYLALALLILLQERRGLAPRLLFVFSLAVAIELALPSATIGNVGLMAVALTAYYLLTGLEIGVELHLASVIPEPARWLSRRPWVVPCYYLAGLGLATLTAATFLSEDILGLDPFPWTSGWIEQVLLRFGLPVWALSVVILLAVPTFNHPRARGRQQAGLVLTGVMPWALFVLLTTVVERAQIVSLGWLSVLEPLVLLCYPVAVFVAIFRYHLFDIEVTVRRSLLYAAASAALFVVFFSVLGAGGAVFSRLFEERGAVWAIAAATLVLGLLFGPLMRAIQRWVDRRLFPERHALRAHLVTLAAELPALGKLPRMGEHLVERICGIFGARAAALFIADPAADRMGLLAARRPPDGEELDRNLLLSLSDPAITELERLGRPVALDQLELGEAAAASVLLPLLDDLGASLVVPLSGHRRLAGVLALGPRNQGERFRHEEIELLELLARHVAVVFENARLFESATYEGLTGLLRREAILERLEGELDRAQRHERPLTVGLGDLDHFKTINDRFGHLAGDSLLKRIGASLQACLRSADAVGRYGGEEFLLVLPETDLQGSQVAAEKMRQAVESTCLPVPGDEEAAVTISIGLASLDELIADGAHHVTGEDLLAAADRALYRAKGEGRNRVHPLLTRVG